MLEYLRLRDVGPGPEFELNLAPRLNLFTGDNGVGKTFILDVAWWALTRTWARLPARPQRGKGVEPTIEVVLRGASGPRDYASKFDWPSQSWPGRGRGRPLNPGMVIYAQSDGGFSVWDPARNYWKKTAGVDDPNRPPAYLFAPGEVWNGLPEKAIEPLCNGLIRDWTNWRLERGEADRQLCAVLKDLSESEDEPLLPGKLVRMSLDDSRDTPTLDLPYQRDVPVTLVSAGMRRIIALAYLLVWTWREHERASELLNRPVTRQIVFLIDELEAHLHPRWQRTVLRSLLSVMNTLTGAAQVPVQVIAATHSPMVLASMEPLFDAQSDALWHMKLVDRRVVVEREAWYRRGEVGHWLTSNAFGLAEARSLEAERAIVRALALYLAESPDPAEIVAVNAALASSLSDIDPFWLRWRGFVAEHPGSAKTASTKRAGAKKASIEKRGRR
ncbi:AAA family ATPase [Nannocystaceae bacterium ST9]